MLIRQNIYESVILFLYIFFCLSRCSNAGYSIFSVIGVLVIIFLIKKRIEFNFYPIRTFLIYYVIFFLSLFLAAMLYGDITVVHSTWKYFLWTLPFWIVFLLESKEFRPDIFDGALSLALIAIFLSIVPQLNTQYRVDGYFGKPTLLGTELAIIVPIIIIIAVYRFKQKILWDV